MRRLGLNLLFNRTRCVARSSPIISVVCLKGCAVVCSLADQVVQELLEHSVREEGGKHEEKEYWLHGEVGSGLMQLTPCSGQRTHDGVGNG